MKNRSRRGLWSSSWKKGLGSPNRSIFWRSFTLIANGFAGGFSFGNREESWGSMFSFWFRLSSFIWINYSNSSSQSGLELSLPSQCPSFRIKVLLRFPLAVSFCSGARGTKVSWREQNRLACPVLRLAVRFQTLNPLKRGLGCVFHHCKSFPLLFHRSFGLRWFFE